MDGFFWIQKYFDCGWQRLRIVAFNMAGYDGKAAKWYHLWLKTNRRLTTWDDFLHAWLPMISQTLANWSQYSSSKSMAHTPKELALLPHQWCAERERKKVRGRGYVREIVREKERVVCVIIVVVQEINSQRMIIKQGAADII